MTSDSVLASQKKLSERQSKQQGFALLTVLMVVALVSMVASELFYQQQLSVQRSSYMIHQAHSLSVAYGFESWVKKGLRLDAKNNDTDHLQEQWAQPLLPVEFAQGLVSGQLRDATARLNVNNVLAEDEAQQRFWQETLDRYWRNNVPAELAMEPFAQPLTDWVDADNDPLPYGAEGDRYLLQNPAYRTANTAMVMVSELRLLEGVQSLNGEAFFGLQAHLTALPKATPININTAGVPVLMALADWLTEPVAQEWVQTRQTTPAEDIETFMTFMQQQTGFALEEIETTLPRSSLAVTSEFFELEALVEYGEVNQKVLSLFARQQNNQVSVIQRWLEVD